MHLFYHKHYEATTPFWLRGLVLAGLVLRGGVALTSEVLKSLVAEREKTVEATQ